MTHDQAEALILSDRVAVLSKGELQQVADPVTIYERPANMFVADFIGSPGINFLSGTLDDGAVTVAGRALEGVNAEGTASIVLGIRPEDVQLQSPGEGIIDGTIEFTESYGGVIIAFIALDGGDGLLVDREYVAASIDVHEPVTVGARIGIAFRANRITLFDAESGLSLAQAG